MSSALLFQQLLPLVSGTVSISPGLCGVHYHVHNSQPLLPTLSQINPLHVLPPICLCSTLTLSSPLHLGLPIALFPSAVPTKSFSVSLHHALNMIAPSVSLSACRPFQSATPRCQPFCAQTASSVQHGGSVSQCPSPRST